MFCGIFCGPVTGLSISYILAGKSACKLKGDTAIDIEKAGLSANKYAS
jgi:hypothetical protein